MSRSSTCPFNFRYGGFCHYYVIIELHLLKTNIILPNFPVEINFSTEPLLVINLRPFKAKQFFFFFRVDLNCNLLTIVMIITKPLFKC